MNKAVAGRAAQSGQKNALSAKECGARELTAEEKRQWAQIRAGLEVDFKLPTVLEDQPAKDAAAVAQAKAKIDEIEKRLAGAHSETKLTNKTAKSLAIDKRQLEALVRS